LAAAFSLWINTLFPLSPSEREIARQERMKREG